MPFDYFLLKKKRKKENERGSNFKIIEKKPVTLWKIALDKG